MGKTSGFAYIYMLYNNSEIKEKTREIMQICIQYNSEMIETFFQHILDGNISIKVY